MRAWRGGREADSAEHRAKASPGRPFPMGVWMDGGHHKEILLLTCYTDTCYNIYYKNKQGKTNEKSIVYD